MPTQNLLCQGTIKCNVAGSSSVPGYAVYFPDVSCPGKMYDGKAFCGSDKKSAGSFKGGIYDCLNNWAFSTSTSIINDSNGVTIKNKPENRKTGEVK